MKHKGGTESKARNVSLRPTEPEFLMLLQFYLSREALWSSEHKVALPSFFSLKCSYLHFQHWGCVWGRNFHWFFSWLFWSQKKKKCPLEGTLVSSCASIKPPTQLGYPFHLTADCCLKHALPRKEANRCGIFQPLFSVKESDGCREFAPDVVTGSWVLLEAVVVN